MAMIRTTVFIDEEILFLARYKGLENLSDFVRKALEGFVLDDDDIKVKNPIHEKHWSMQRRPNTTSGVRRKLSVTRNQQLSKSKNTNRNGIMLWNRRQSGYS